MKVIEALRTWREDDHEDAIKLTRHEIITLIEEHERLRAELQQHNDALWVGLERAKDVRAATIEECARMVSSFKGIRRLSLEELATAIRALKE